MATTRYQLSNDDFGFVTGVTVRLPGCQILDVRVGTSRVLQPRDWAWPAARLSRMGDTATLQFDRPDNPARLLVDIVCAGDSTSATPLGQLHRLPDEPLAAVRQRLAGQRIVFLGTARDCAKALPASVHKLNSLGRLFAGHALHVFENDSSDGSGELLDTMARDQLLVAHREQGIAVQMPLRTERLAYARNRLLDSVLAPDAPPWDYICWADLDGLVGERFSEDGFVSNFRHEAAWDAVFPLSWPLYYDMYALREDTLCPRDYVLDGQQRFDAMLGPAAAQIHAVTQQLAPGRLKGWLPVRSAFGGFGLYKAEVARAGRYVGLIDGQEVCEHVPYHEALCRAGARLFLNPDCITHIA